MSAPATFDEWLAECLAWYGDPWRNRQFVPIEYLALGLSLARAERDLSRADLLRLAGPVCPHDGKRAIEHTHANGYCRAANGDYRHGENCRKHPAAPEIEEWLRTRRTAKARL